MRVVFCIWAAIVAGFGLATVFGLGTAAVSAAIYKSQTDLESPVYEKVQATGPTVIVAASSGFVIGAGVIVWLFWSSRPRRTGTAEPGESSRSEV